MGVQVSNNAYSTLFSGLSAVATSLTVASGHGSRFPSASPGAGTYFYVTLIKSSGVTEIVKVTARATDVFTIVRGQDGTTATTFTAGDRVELRPIAALFNSLPNRLLITADYTDLSVTNAKLDTILTAVGPVGGLGKFLTATVNSKGRITALTETNGIVQTNTYSVDSTWTKPTGAGSLVRIQCWAGGGGGGRAASGDGGHGGGGGGYMERWMSLADISTSSVSVNVGTGGAGATAANTSGQAGFNSSFGSYVTAYGGGGGSGAMAGGGGGGGGELAKGITGTATSPGSGGAIGGGHGAIQNTGGTAATSTARGTLSEAYTDFPASLGSGTSPNILVPWGFGNDARTMFGGGGGGGGITASGTGSQGRGGFAVWGGGGGGGGYDTSRADNASLGGSSLYGGSGGAGATVAANATNGSVPGGGGGGAETGNGGSGGDGQVIVTVYV